MILNYLNLSSLNINTMGNYLSDKYLNLLNKRYLFDKDKIASGGGRILLKYILDKNYGIEDYSISIDKQGKPFLDSHPNIHFNISHSGEIVFVGVSYKPIGVDIEKIHDLDYKELSNHFFHLNEYKTIINSKDPLSTFFKIWTSKESFVKMKGTGIVVDLDSFIINSDESIHVINKKIIKDENCNINKDKNFIKSNMNLKTWNILNKQYWMAICSKKRLIENPKEIQLFTILNTLN
jgi:4'-phosphopantetheinyl transferase